MRSIENKIVSYPLSTGMNESSGRRAAPAGTLYAVRNLRTRYEGSLQKRFGSLTLSGDTQTNGASSGDVHVLVNSSDVVRPTEHPMFISAIGNQRLVASTAGDVFSYGTSKWQFKGCCSTCLPLDASAALAGADAYTCAFGYYAPAAAAMSNGYVCVAAVMQDSTLRVVIRDPNGNVIFSDDQAITPRFKMPVRVMAAGTSRFHILYLDDAHVQRASLAISGGAVSGSLSGSLLVNVDSGGYWDADIDSAGMIWIAYQSSSGPGVTTVASYNGSGVLQLSDTFPSTSPLLSIRADNANDMVWVGYADDLSGSPVIGFRSWTKSNMNPAIGAITIVSGHANIGDNPSPPLFGPSYVGNAGGATIVYSISSASTFYTRTMHYLQVNSSGALGTVSSVCNWMPVSKPDSQQRVWCISSLAGAETMPATSYRYALLRLEDAVYNFTGSNFTRGVPVELATADLIAVGLNKPDGAFGYGWFFGPVAECDDWSAMPLGIPVATQSIGAAVVPTIQVQLYRYETPDIAPHKQVVTAGGQSIIISGTPTEITGAGAHPSETPGVNGSVGGMEVGYLHPAAILEVTANSLVGGPIPAGTYSYVAVFQSTDENGNRILSVPSAPVAVTPTTDCNITVRVARYNSGQRVGFMEPSVLIYRTVDGGDTYQLLPAQPAAAADSFSLTDTVSDDDLSANEFLYTDGGVLPNTLAPSCRFIAAAEDRLWCGGLWDPKLIEASKIHVPGEPWNFTGDASHQIVLPEACTGLAYMDGQIIAFTASSIYLVGGDGPNDQGAGQFLPPRMLIRGIGCIDYRSIVETPDGVFFLSELGLNVIPRGFGAPVYIGKATQDTLVADPTILSACMTQNENYRLVKFLFEGSDTPGSGTTVLVYDIDSDRWFLDTYNATGTSGGVSFAGFAELGDWDGGLVLCRYDLNPNANTIWYESADTFADAGANDVGNDTFVATYIEMCWVEPFGPGGWGRLNKFLLTMDNDSGGDTELVEVRISTDSVEETISWQVPGNAVPPEVISYRGLDVSSRTCTTFRAIITGSKFSIADTRGPKFNSIAFELEPSDGIRMLKDTERT